MVEAGHGADEGRPDNEGEMGTGDRGLEQVPGGDDAECAQHGAGHDQEDGDQGEHHRRGGPRTEVGSTTPKQVQHPAEDNQGHRHDGEGRQDVDGLLHDRGSGRVEERLGIGAEGQEAERRRGDQQDATVGGFRTSGRGDDVQRYSEYGQRQ